MKDVRKGIALSATLLAAGASLLASPVVRAQEMDTSIPTYTTWQSGWDTYQYDRHHVMLGVVASFAPYRLTVTRRNGVTQVVDLKHGTVIFPTGMTPSTGERVALVGYYSNGTFVVNRVILHP